MEEKTPLLQEKRSQRQATAAADSETIPKVESKVDAYGAKRRETVTELQQSDEHTHHLCACLPVYWLNIFLALLTMSTLVFKSVSLPAYISAVVNAGSDPFSVVLIAGFWFQCFFLLVSLVYKIFIDSSMSMIPTTKWKFLILIGFLNGVAGIPLVFASDPTRTPPYLQALLSTVVIPLTVIFRYIILRKVVGVKRLLCTFFVIVGFVISLIPQLTGDEQHPSEMCSFDQIVPLNKTNESFTYTYPASAEVSPTYCMKVDPPPLWYRLTWPLIYALGYVPISIMFVMAEKEMKRYEVRSFTFLLWLHIITFLTLVLLFWTDLIPEFGMAASIDEFYEKLVAGIHCHFSTEPRCENVLLTSWMYVLGNCSNLLFQFLLTRHGEGSVYPTVVSAIATPLSALFWTIFVLDPFYVFSPSFNITTIFILAGLAVMIPSVIFYNIFSIQEERLRRMSKLSEG